MKKVIKGTIFYTDLDSIKNSVGKKYTPVIVVNSGLSSENNVVIVPIVTLENISSKDVLIKQFNKVRPNSIASLDQIQTINKILLKGYVDMLENDTLEELEDIIKKLTEN